ncbi:hypothetical protein ACOJBM_06835 [Rhizobium beringeri]
MASMEAATSLERFIAAVQNDFEEKARGREIDSEAKRKKLLDRDGRRA